MIFNRDYRAATIAPNARAKRALLAKAKAIKSACYSGKVWHLQVQCDSLLVAAPNESEALDAAVDAGLMDAHIMSESEYTEYDANGWHDSFTYAGNAGEPVWTENLYIKRVI